MRHIDQIFFFNYISDFPPPANLLDKRRPSASSWPSAIFKRYDLRAPTSSIITCNGPNFTQTGQQLGGCDPWYPMGTRVPLLGSNCPVFEPALIKPRSRGQKPSLTQFRFREQGPHQIYFLYLKPANKIASGPINPERITSSTQQT